MGMARLQSGVEAAGERHAWRGERRLRCGVVLLEECECNDVARDGVLLQTCQSKKINSADSACTYHNIWCEGDNACATDGNVEHGT